MLLTRRGGVRTGLAGVVLGRELLQPVGAWATPLGLPLGLELYSVRDELPKDFAGTLKTIGGLGYQEVEGADVAGLYKKPAAEVKQAVAAAGLRWRSAHYSWGALAPDIEGAFAYQKELGAEYVICASPGRKDASAGGGGMHGLTMDDWRYNADNFNKAGEKAKSMGLRFGYHNHIAEFEAQDGVVPFEELMRLTDSSLVTFEMDCGWVMVGGGDPVALLRKYPTRISMLHVKDFKPKVAGQERPEAADLGKGTVDYRPIFAAAKQAGGIRHCFVEQEGFDEPWTEALKTDAAYMKSFHG